LELATTIVGAGPYGLSIAAHLRAARLPFELFGTPLESWRRFMPKGMVLKSERFASNLWDPRRRYTLQRYCQERGAPYQPVGSPVSLEHFLEYAEWFRRHAAGESHDVKILQVRRLPQGFALELADGRTLTSRRVILATGHMTFRALPQELRHLPEPLVLHSTRIDDVNTYAGRDITIIGAGQSALETAALLHEAGAHVRVLVRGGHVAWNAPSKPRSLLERILEPDAGVASGWTSFVISEFPRAFRQCFPAAKRHRFVAGSYGPSGAWWLRDRVAGRVEIRLNANTIAAAPANERVRLSVQHADGVQQIVTDHVIAATGFKIDIDRLDYLEPSLRQSIAREARGIPALDSCFESSVPGLFIVGVASAPVFGPIMRFMYGSKHVAPVLARRLKSAA
jgi:FAD-dependent urate hydroxylase